MKYYIALERVVSQVVNVEIEADTPQLARDIAEIHAASYDWGEPTEEFKPFILIPVDDWSGPPPRDLERPQLR